MKEIVATLRRGVKHLGLTQRRDDATNEKAFFLNYKNISYQPGGIA